MNSESLNDELMIKSGINNDMTIDIGIPSDIYFYNHSLLLKR